MNEDERISKLEDLWQTTVERLPPEQALPIIEGKITALRDSQAQIINTFTEEQPSYQPTSHYVRQALDLARTRYQYSQQQPVAQVTATYTPVDIIESQDGSWTHHDGDEKAKDIGWAIATGVTLGCTVLAIIIMVKSDFQPLPNIPNTYKPPPTEIALDPSPAVGDKIGTRRVTSAFGWRTHPITGKRQFHNGVDVGAPSGTPYIMPGQQGTKGKVICWEPGQSRGGGYVANITSNDERYKKIKIQVMHLKAGTCVPGEHTAGNKIGEVGSTGISTGPHAHVSQVVNGEKVAPSATFVKEIFGYAAN
jgi:murein DD-endopeptidase MepM/ murein hydrolase activator NlpD